jgi:hypothetical protein
VGYLVQPQCSLRVIEFLGCGLFHLFNPSPLYPEFSGVCFNLKLLVAVGPSSQERSVLALLELVDNLLSKTARIVVAIGDLLKNVKELATVPAISLLVHLRIVLRRRRIPSRLNSRGVVLLAVRAFRAMSALPVALMAAGRRMPIAVDAFAAKRKIRRMAAREASPRAVSFPIKRRRRSAVNNCVHLSALSVGTVIAVNFQNARWSIESK